MPPVIGWTISSTMVLIAFFVWGLLVFYAQRSPLATATRRRFAAASGAYLLGWLALAFALGSHGVFHASPARQSAAVPVAIALSVLIGALFVYRSSALRTIIAAIPLPWLVGVQVYRAFGLSFLVLYGLGQLPAEFAIPAGAGDVVVGLAAPAVAYLFQNGFRGSCLAVLGWNLVGILDLFVAVATGFLSSPGPFQALALNAPNELITVFPLVLVPTFAVPLSMLLHLAAIKRLKGVGIASREAFTCDSQLLRLTLRMTMV